MVAHLADLDGLNLKSVGLVVLIGFALANYKVWVFFWHVRLFRVIVPHVNNTKPAGDEISAKLFQSVITKSHCPILEIDYNLHKSNSTYFSDLDICRTKLVLAMFSPVLAVTRSGGTLSIALGGVACNFKKEIKPYQSYEIHSRILCWDAKWIFVVSWFIRPQGGKSQAGTGSLILASAIAKYVFKRGRKSVAPAEVLRIAGLLGGCCDKSQDMLEIPTDVNMPATKDENLITGLDGAIGNLLQDWAAVEARRRQGMLFARQFAQLQGLMDEFDIPATTSAKYQHSVELQQTQH